MDADRAALAVDQQRATREVAHLVGEDRAEIDRPIGDGAQPRPQAAPGAQGPGRRLEPASCDPDLTDHAGLPHRRRDDLSGLAACGLPGVRVDACRLEYEVVCSRIAWP